MARILIAGCGDVGLRTAKKLLATGHSVWALRRHCQNAVTVDGLQWIQADLTDLDSLEHLPKVFDYIVFCPAPKAGAKKLSRQALYEQVYITGLTNMLQFADKCFGLKRIFFVSSTSVYGQDNGQWVSEESPTEPKAFNGKILLQAENKLINSRFLATIIRSAGIYGPNRYRFLERILSGAELRSQYTNRIHSEDLAAVLSFLIQLDSQGRKLDSIYLAVDNLPCTEYEIATWLCRYIETINRQPPALGPPPKAGLQNKRCSGQRLNDLGYRYSYPSYQQGYAEIVDAYFANNLG